MSAKIGREDMPAHAECGNDGQKNLPAASEAMQQHEGRTVGWALGIVQADFADVELVLRNSWEGILHTGYLALYTSLPPTHVLSTFTSRIFTGSTLSTSSLNSTMSASLPGVIEPFTLS